MRLVVVTQGRERRVVAEIEDYRGPVPRTGEYIACPGKDITSLRPGRPFTVDRYGEDIVMIVKAVTYRILREPALAGEDGFQSADDVTVELHV